jgi:hypothetical protein
MEFHQQNRVYMDSDLSALVKDPRQFKPREKRLLKVVAVNLSLYKQPEY